MFDSLIETRRQRSRPRSWASVPVSLAIHLIVVGSGVVATLWAVDELPEPPIPISFYSSPPPAAPPRGTTPSPPKQQQPRKQEPRPQITQIDTIPVEVPAVKSEPEETDGGGGSGPGIPDGVPWGTGDGQGPLGPIQPKEVVPEPEPEAQVPIHVGGDFKEPQRVYEVKPVYPEVARRAGLQGPVILETIVDRQGAVRDIRVLRGQPLGLTEAAVDAVRQWRYEPSFYNGRSVEVYVIVTVHFRLG